MTSPRSHQASKTHSLSRWVPRRPLRVPCPPVLGWACRHRDELRLNDMDRSNDPPPADFSSPWSKESLPFTLGRYASGGILVPSVARIRDSRRVRCADRTAAAPSHSKTPVRLPLLALLAATLLAAGCSSTSRLFVFNDTPNPYAMRVNRSATAYALKPASKHNIPEKLLRDRAYDLVVLEKGGQEHKHSIFTHAAQLYVRLHLSEKGELEWALSTTPPPDS